MAKTGRLARGWGCAVAAAKASVMFKAALEGGGAGSYLLLHEGSLVCSLLLQHGLDDCTTHGRLRRPWQCL
jgi:hypothetical protein